MANQPCVSVIIPCFNASQWIGRTIRSCLQQGELLGEIIVVDDFSDDDSHAIVSAMAEADPGKILLYRNVEKGGNNARNFGFAKSRFEFVQWLDADDLLCPGKFDKQVAAFHNDPEVDLTFSDWSKTDFDENGSQVNSVLIQMQDTDDFLGDLLSDKWSVPCSYLVRRQLAEQLDQIGAWNRTRRIGQDREYFTLAAMLARKCTYVPGMFSRYVQVNSNSVSKMSFSKRLELQMDLEKRLRDEIMRRVPNQFKRNIYTKRLNSHIYNAFFYNRSIVPPFLFLPWNIDTRIIHWKKIAILPVLYLALVGRYLMTHKPTQSASDEL